MISFTEFQEMDLNGKTAKKEYLFDRIAGMPVFIPQELASKADRHAEIRKNNHKHHNKSDFNDEADRVGLYGECAFATKYGLEVDWQIKLKDAYDFKIGDTLIDVKTSEYNPYLTVKLDRIHPEYMYVWCVCRIEFNDAKIVGWLMGHDVPKLGEIVTKYFDEKLEEPYWKVSYTLLNRMATIKF